MDILNLCTEITTTEDVCNTKYMLLYKDVLYRSVEVS